jgi:hypothetical protein
MIKKNIQINITKPKIVIVEGQDEVKLLRALIKHLNLPDDIDIQDASGKDNIRRFLMGLMQSSNHEIVTSIGIVRDADQDPAAAFQSVCSALQGAGLPRPPAPLQPVGDTPQVFDEPAFGRLKQFLAGL